MNQACSVSDQEMFLQNLPLEAKQVLRARQKILQAIRMHFDSENFLEVETPALTFAPDPAVHLDSFKTTLCTESKSERDMYLMTSPEHYMKRMLAFGFERIYQICHFFRNGDIGPVHNPEFTGLEWYQIGTGMEDCMNRTEKLMVWVSSKALEKTFVVRNGRTIELRPPYLRFSIREALMSFGGLKDVPDDWDPVALKRRIEDSGIKTAPDDSLDDLVHRVLLNRVEPALATLDRPVFLFEFPAKMGAMAQLKPEKPQVAERFELYAGGLELCNGYAELTDAKEQRTRFLLQLEERRRLLKPSYPLDESFLAALDKGIPSCSGCALGVDRLVMLLLEKENIDEVLAFALSLRS